MLRLWPWLILPSMAEKGVGKKTEFSSLAMMYLFNADGVLVEVLGW